MISVFPIRLGAFVRGIKNLGASGSTGNYVRAYSGWGSPEGTSWLYVDCIHPLFKLNSFLLFLIYIHSYSGTSYPHTTWIPMNIDNHLPQISFLISICVSNLTLPNIHHFQRVQPRPTHALGMPGWLWATDVRASPKHPTVSHCHVNWFILGLHFELTGFLSTWIGHRSPTYTIRWYVLASELWSRKFGLLGWLSWRHNDQICLRIWTGRHSSLSLQSSNAISRVSD